MKQTIPLVSLILALVVYLASCIGNSKSEGNTTFEEDIQQETVNSGSEVNEQAEANTAKGNWDYQASTDPMTDKESHMAVCVSNEEHSICGSLTNLFLGLHYADGNTHVMLGVKGGVLRQDELPMAHVRFDKGEVEMWSVIADGATTHHIVKSAEFINRLKKSKTCAIKVEAQDGGAATFTFNTEGLEWSY